MTAPEIPESETNQHWHGYRVLQPVFSDAQHALAELPPEPEAGQGAYNPQMPEAALALPQLEAQRALQPVELLAPAGGPEAGYAAFKYGADAIYLGMKRFSARAEAENFSLEELEAIVAFAHTMSPPRKVFVTINTLILQHELSELLDSLAFLERIEVDALIVQDLGLYRLVKKYFPRLELHASTQLAVHNAAGAQTLRELGFTRVVLAREMTFEEVLEIAQSAGVETEVFVHGALCYSYSGLCLFSAQTIGRSGNRGKCAYTCRDSYTIHGAPETLRDGTPTKRKPDRGFPFSMKDLALPDHIPALRAAGVACFKIEGRKKSPLYVATTTDYYRRILDGTLEQSDRAQIEADLQTVFSRPWTRLFVQSHRDKEVADRDSTHPLGAAIGMVESSFFDETGRWLQFRSSRRLEVRDGLQLNLPGLDRPFGFSIQELRYADMPESTNTKDIKRKAPRLYETAADRAIQVLLPPDAPELPPGQTIYCNASQHVRQQYPTELPSKPLRVQVPIAIRLEVKPQALSATATLLETLQETQCTRTQETDAPYQPARDPASTAMAAQETFSKLGGTAFRLHKFECLNPQQLFVPISILTHLRRSLIEALEAQHALCGAERLQRLKAEVLVNSGVDKKHTCKVEPLRWSLKVDRLKYLDAFEAQDWVQLDEVIVDLSRDALPNLVSAAKRLGERIGPEKIRFALPALTRKWEEKNILTKLARLRAEGWQRWEVANVSAWALLNQNPNRTQTGTLLLSSDWSLYVVNRAAALQLKSMGVQRFALSPEDGLSNMRMLLQEFADEAVTIVYQDTPIFAAESCAYANIVGGCPGKANCRFEQMELVSSHGDKVLALDYHCRTIVLNQSVYSLSTRLKDLQQAGARHVRADFIYRPYDASDVLNLWRLIRAGKPVPGGQAANFDRGLL